METKICPCCKQEKPISEFGSNKSKTNGLNCYCKECSTKKSMEYYFRNLEKARATRKRYREKNPDEHRRLNREWYANNKDRIHEHITEYRKNNHLRKLITSRLADARRKEIDYDSLDDLYNYLKSIYDNGKCEYCGKELQNGVGKGDPQDNYFSIDKVNPGRGYFVNNVAILCRECNRKKDNLTWQEHLAMSNWQREKEISMSENNQIITEQESVVT